MLFGGHCDPLIASNKASWLLDSIWIPICFYNNTQKRKRSGNYSSTYVYYLRPYWNGGLGMGLIFNDDGHFGPADVWWGIITPQACYCRWNCHWRTNKGAGGGDHKLLPRLSALHFYSSNMVWALWRFHLGVLQSRTQVSWVWGARTPPVPWTSVHVLWHPTKR